MTRINATALLSVYLAEQAKELFDSLAGEATVERNKLMELHLLADHATRTFKCSAEATGRVMGLAVVCQSALWLEKAK